MLGGWILDLGDGVDAMHINFVKVFSSMFFLVLREYSVLRYMFPCEFERERERVVLLEKII
jgi:hypothetical protein